MSIQPAGLLDRLSTALSQALPGHSAFLEHAGYDGGRIAKALAKDPAPKISAVLLALFPIDGVWHIVLMKRPAYDGVHSGQIGFPGGKQEQEDTSLEATALREFEEETGAAIERFEVIGAMSRLYIPPSRSLVTPYLAWSATEPTFDPDEREVESLIVVPFTDLLDTEILKTTDQLTWALGKELSVPYFDVQGEVVWGATALMIAELRELCGVALD